MSEQITTVCLFELDGFSQQYWAFKQVPLALGRLQSVPGLTFFKSMGSGGGKGFDLMPSFRVYAWLMVWENQTRAQDFFTSNAYFQAYRQRCQSAEVLYLKNIMAHGKWSGSNPFLQATGADDSGQVVVLTRGRIKASRLVQFWRKVGRTANELFKTPDLEFAIGVGELPFIQQATLSVWKNKAAMQHYAYTDATHKNVIRLTRKHQWYSEELFARFSLTAKVQI
jgi:hypothetical protein